MLFRSSRGDGEVWHCEQRVGGAEHKRQMSIRHDFDSFYFENFSAIGSFLDNSKLTPLKFIVLAYFWAHGSSAQEQQNFCDVNLIGDSKCVFLLPRKFLSTPDSLRTKFSFYHLRCS